jgi:hypothetical protein
MNGKVAPLKTKKNKIEIITIWLAGKTLLFWVLLRLYFIDLFDMT